MKNPHDFGSVPVQSVNKDKFPTLNPITQKFSLQNYLGMKLAKKSLGTFSPLFCIKPLATPPARCQLVGTLRWLEMQPQHRRTQRGSAREPPEQPWHPLCADSLGCFMDFPPLWQEDPLWEAATGPGGCERSLASWDLGNMVGPGSWRWPDSSSGSARWENELKRVDLPLLHGGEQKDAHPSPVAHSQCGTWWALVCSNLNLPFLPQRCGAVPRSREGNRSV